MVATPLGPNHDMKARVAVSVRVPASAANTATGRATSRVTTTTPTAAQPEPKRPCSVSRVPNTTKIPSLTSSTMSAAWRFEVAADVGAADAEDDRSDVDRDQPVAVRRQHRQPVGGKRGAQREQRALVRRDAVLQPHVAGSQPGGGEAHGHAHREAEHDVLDHEPPPHEVAATDGQGRAERQHRRQRQAVVEPRLQVERVTDHRRHARVGDDARGQHRIGGRQQRSHQERLRPRQTGQQPRAQRDDHRGQRHRQHELAKGQAASVTAAAHRRPRARRGTG